MTDDFTSSNNARNRANGDTYLQSFSEAAVKRLAHSKHGRIHKLDRDDIASRMVLRVLLNLDDYRRRYPKPETLAAVMLEQATIGYFRAEGAQRGDGARGGRDFAEFGSWTDTRPSLGEFSRLDAEETYRRGPIRRTYNPLLAESLTASNLDGPDGYPDSDLVQTYRLLDAALLATGVDERGRWLLRRVDGDGVTVTEAAYELGIARETAQRALGKARKAASAAAAQWRADGRPMPW